MCDQNITEKFASFQEYLDNYAYCNEKILSYEKLYGRMYCSPGGERTTKEFCNILQLQEGQLVLDLCCGMGGGSFDMARKLGVRVVGVDLSHNMLDIAQIRRQELNMENEVSFLHADVTKVDFPVASFDAITCRDSFVHLKDKRTLLQKCLRWLKPGGQMLFSDFVCPCDQWTQEYSDYCASYGYYAITVGEYAKLLTAVGFVNVQAMDKTASFTQILKDELRSFLDKKEELFKDGMSETCHKKFAAAWEKKLERAECGEQRWGWFLVEKSKTEEQT